MFDRRPGTAITGLAARRAYSGDKSYSMRQRDIFLFWLPLFASWLLMTAEGPIVSAAINRLPNEVIMLAAQGLVVSISVTIESPIINMLATSTALTRDRASYLLLRKFTFHWMIGLTVVTVLLAFTPLFDLVVRRLLAVPDEVSVWVRPGLQIMTLWSAAIAWRRFLQGVMIRFGETRKVAWGTAVRLTSSGGTVVLLAVSTSLPGVVIGATALMAGVVSEALYATLAVRPILNNQLAPDAKDSQGPALTYRELFWFHLPLASTSLLILLVQPMVAFSLARLPQPTRSLAAWPVVFQILLIARASALALPEAIIALSDGRQTFTPLRRFALTIFAVTTLAMIIFVFSPLAAGYLYGVQDLTSAVGELARSGLFFAFMLPGVTVLVSWVRGLLIHAKATRPVNAGMVVNVIVTAAILAVGMLLRWPGIVAAVLALTVATGVEFFYLWWRAGRALKFPLTFTGMDHQQPVPS